MRKYFIPLMLLLAFATGLRAQSAQQRLASLSDADYDGYDIVTLFDSTRVVME